MRRRTMLATASLGTAALATAAVVVAGQSAASADDTLTAKETFTGVFTEDLGKKGPSIGDRLTFRSVVTSLDGDRLGFSGGLCTLLKGTTATNAVYHCSQSYTLDGNQLFVGGIFTYAKKVNTWSILGGTGKYLGATGQAAFTTLTEDSFKDVFTFDD